MGAYWALIEQARADATADSTVWPAGQAIGAALTDRLSQVPPEQILEFESCHRRTARRAQQWTVCAAAYVIWNYVSDDAFSDFTFGLVGLGQVWFEQAVHDPDTLADHPLVQSIAQDRANRFMLSGEQIQFAPAHAYGRSTGDEDAFWEDSVNLPAEDDDLQVEPGQQQQWSGRFGSPDDAARIPVRLPHLHRLFASTAADHP
jgi:Protein of unknown function (DUF4240)